MCGIQIWTRVFCSSFIGVVILLQREKIYLIKKIKFGKESKMITPFGTEIDRK